MSVYKESSFRAFIESAGEWENIQWNKSPMKKDTVIDDLVSEAAYKDTSLFSHQNYGKLLRNIFSNSFPNKPRSISWFRFFLYTSGYKRCYVCKERKPIKDFGKRNSKWDKLEIICRGCVRERDRDRPNRKGKTK